MLFHVHERRQVILHGDLMADNTAAVMAEIQNLLSQGVVEVMIASGGGHTEPSLALSDLMLGVRQRVVLRTLGAGRVASSAVLLLAAGTPGERYLLSGADILLHESSYTFNERVCKTTTEWEDWVVDRRHCQNRFWGALARCSGQPAEGMARCP